MRRVHFPVDLCRGTKTIFEQLYRVYLPLYFVDPFVAIFFNTKERFWRLLYCLL